MLEASSEKNQTPSTLLGPVLVDVLLLHLLYEVRVQRSAGKLGSRSRRIGGRSDPDRRGGMAQSLGRSHPTVRKTWSCVARVSEGESCGRQLSDSSERPGRGSVFSSSPPLRRLGGIRGLVADRLRIMPRCARFCNLMFRNFKQIRMSNSTHNPKVAGSNPAPATNKSRGYGSCRGPFFIGGCVGVAAGCLV